MCFKGSFGMDEAEVLEVDDGKCEKWSSFTGWTFIYLNVVRWRKDGSIVLYETENWPGLYNYGCHDSRNVVVYTNTSEILRFSIPKLIPQ